ncbi:MAG: PDDEXK nuclease domain-containing protein [Cetobacterium sp.]|uniref:PDDEXK nuclease domain-containing protein n=1 Tax=Cetobacterium sp. TaxID=2071632 RepID=UPI002FC8435C
MELERRDNLYDDIKTLLESARKKVLSTVNSTMTLTYFLIGKKIVEEEQNGELRAEYGKELIKNISIKLTEEYGKGFSETNLKQMKSFYEAYKNSQTVSDQFKLGWSHYITLMRVKNIDERNFYEIEAINNNWSLRELKRQMNTALYERLILSRDKEEVKALSTKGQIIEKPKDIIKDPYVLEFLGLEEISNYSENTLETTIINHIEKFIMELGKGFLFQGRQVRFTFDEEHFFVDLVFYNRILKCFVLIDLKIGKLKHQDIGQMQMYVNYYDRFVKLDDENKTIGIIICKDKNDTLVEITLPENNEQIFASRYMTILPSKEELVKIIEEEDINEK